MTQDEMRIAIAEKCGWHIHDANAFFGRHVDGCHSATLPDYCNDLNAIAVAEGALGYPEIVQYRDALTLIALEDESAMPYWCATAAQRAEAICRVFWPEKFND